MSLKFKSQLFLLVVLMGGLFFARGQEFIRGRLLDSETREPVVFATILIKGKGKGIITNQDGSFRLPKEYRMNGHIISISCMGYQTKEVSLVSLSLSKMNIISVAPAILSLSEAVVTAKRKRRFSARGIVRRAIAAIPKNYPKYTFSTTGYYRDYQLDEGEYINLNEAILNVYDEGFGKIDSTTTKVEIFEYNQNSSFKRDSLSIVPYNYRDRKKFIENVYLPAYGGNEFLILRIHDPIRNYKLNTFDFINNLQSDLLQKHSFKRLSDTYLEDEDLYTISFKRRITDYTTKSTGYSDSGTLYIAKNDFSIHKLTYAVYDDRKIDLSPDLRKEGIKGKVMYELNVEYKRDEQNQLFLNYISFHNTFRLGIPPEFFVREVIGLPLNEGFSVVFNKPLSHKSFADKKSNYKFLYQGQRLRFKSIKVFNDSVVLKPDLSKKEYRDMMDELNSFKKKGISTQFALDIMIEGIVDVDNIMLHKWSYKDYSQFREFFAQKIKPFTKAPEEKLFMNKNFPIFKNQPISKPDNFGDYWMNTPLQKFKN